MEIAVFNRIYTGKQNGIYIIEFPDPLVLYEDKSKNIIYSNRYGIEFPNEDMYRDKLYNLARLNVLLKYDEGVIKDAKVYTQVEWEEHLDAIRSSK